MDSVDSNFSSLGISKQIVTETKSRPVESTFFFILFALPIIGALGKLVESGHRIYHGSEGMAEAALNNAGLSNKSFTMIEYKEAILHETRRRQSRDLIFLVARIISLLLFSTATMFTPAGGIVLSVCAIWSIAMFVNAQLDLVEARKHPKVLPESDDQLVRRA